MITSKTWVQHRVHILKNKTKLSCLSLCRSNCLPHEQVFSYCAPEARRQVLSFSVDTEAAGRTTKQRDGGRWVKFCNQIMIPNEIRVKISDHTLLHILNEDLFLCIMHFFPQAFRRVTENTWAKKANLSISFTQVLIILLPVMVKEPTQHTRPHLRLTEISLY